MARKITYSGVLSKTNIAIALILCMLVGLFTSRAVLSVAMFLLGVNGLWGVHPKRWLPQKWWWLGVLWVGFFAISILWSDNSRYWGEHFQVKLPVLLLPLAFSFIPSFHKKQLWLYTCVFCGLMLCGVGYSFSFLIKDPAYYIAGYDYAHLLPTLIENNHIVFSMMLALGVVWCVYIYPFLETRGQQWFVVSCAVIFSVGLNIIAARTGLFAWYIFVAGLVGYTAMKKNTRRLGMGLILLFAVSCFLAVKYVPTLQKRIGHIGINFRAYKLGQLSGNYSDVGRYISYDIAIKLIKERPLTGVGAGNMLDSMKGGYDKWYPDVKDAQRLLPHNQFLVTGIAAGLPAMLAFIVWIFYPLRDIKRNRNGFFFFITWCMLLVPLLVDPFLEIQFGVFVYLFFLLMQRQMMLKPMQEQSENE